MGGVQSGEIVSGLIYHRSQPILVAGESGWLHIGLSVDKYQAGLRDLLQIVLDLAGPGLLIGVLMSFLFANRLTRPISELKAFASKVASGDLDSRVKLDSNGCRPDMLRKLIEGEVVDYVALDYKSPRERFEAVTGRDSFGEFAQSLEMLIGSDVDFETRTTVHSHLLDEQDIGVIILDLENRGYRKNYYVQNFVDHGPSARTLSPLPVNRRLDRSRILASDLFEVRFRNFD